MKVYLVRTRKPDDMGDHQLDSIWLTRKLAHDHAAFAATRMVENTVFLDKGRGEWADAEAVIRPNDSRIQVRAKRWGSQEFTILRSWYIEEHEVLGDSVSALAAVAE